MICLIDDILLNWAMYLHLPKRSKIFVDPPSSFILEVVDYSSLQPSHMGKDCKK